MYELKTLSILVAPVAFVGNFLTSIPIVKDSGDERIVQRLSFIALNILWKVIYHETEAEKRKPGKWYRRKNISWAKNNMTFPVSKMTPGNQYNLAGELSDSNKGINLCFKV